MRALQGLLNCIDKFTNLIEIKQIVYVPGAPENIQKTVINVTKITLQIYTKKYLDTFFLIFATVSSSDFPSNVFLGCSHKGSGHESHHEPLLGGNFFVLNT